MAIKKPKKLRSDKAKNVDKVAAILVKDPFASEATIAKRAKICPSTAHVAKKELKESQVAMKDDRIISLTDGDMKIQEIIQERKLSKLRTNSDNISDSDLNQWDRHSMTRLTTLRGDITDEKGGLRPHKELTAEEIRARLKALGED